jgi:hypothetical protein
MLRAYIGVIDKRVVSKPKEGTLTSACQVACYIYRDNKLAEVWLKCSSINDFYLSLEQLVLIGIVVEKIGFLNGLVCSFKGLEHTGALAALQSDQLVGGELTLRYYYEDKLSHLFQKLYEERLVEKALIYLTKKLVKIKLLGETKSSIFFDSCVRILKPIKLPPI